MIVKVNNWLKLQEKLFEGSWDNKIKRFRSPYAFRGLSSAKYDLKTSLIRLGREHDLLETHLLRNFQKYAHREVVERDSVWHWLTVAQHHGLPTRLLDWTYSPYIALHFATSNMEHFDEDGAIWAVDFFKARELLPDELKSVLFEDGSAVSTADMLATVLKSIKELDKKSPNGKDFVIFFEPPSLDDRIINQFALFSVMSNPEAIFSDWLKDHPKIWHKIIIPARLKWEVRDKLDQAGITERVLFPGLDGLCIWLKRHYSRKPNKKQL